LPAGPNHDRIPNPPGPSILTSASACAAVKSGSNSAMTNASTSMPMNHRRADLTSPPVHQMAADPQRRMDDA
jgi:hypothetical protein